MEWNKGYSASFYAKLIDAGLWRETDTLMVTGGTIKRQQTGKRQAATLQCVNYDGDERWIRVYMDVRQEGSSAHVALFTGLAQSPESEFNGNLANNTIDCHSVLKPAEDVLLPRGWFAPAQASGARLVQQLLSVSPAPITVEDASPVLTTAIISEDGETNLSMADRILDAINWRLRIEGDGTINIGPKPTDPAAAFDPISNDMIETKVKVSRDWYSCPNVLMAVSGDMTGIARDDSPDSPLSTVNRGREVWKLESGVSLAANESIAEYALRKLCESQRVKTAASYDRRYIPDVYPGDIIRVNYPKQGLTGLYEIDSQSVTLGYNAKTSEEITNSSELLRKERNMVTISEEKFTGSADRLDEQGLPIRLVDGYCLSTDTKPLNWENGSTLLEMDTSKVFMFDYDNQLWRELR